MIKVEDKDTRYFIDIDLETGNIFQWDIGQKNVVQQDFVNPYHHRIFLSKGQYNKLINKHTLIIKE